jgi:dTDP-4-amino-4,6-dideoxygalactose transaminase
MSQSIIPYARPFWTSKESDALREVVESGWWTMGPRIQQLEEGLRQRMGAKGVICVANGTVAMLAIFHLLRPESGRVLYVTSALNFLAGPACASMEGFDVAFTDVDPDTLNMDPRSLAQVLQAHAGGYTSIIVNPVHFAGVPVEMGAINDVASRYGAMLVEDSCHALLAEAPGGWVAGNHPASRASVFSFHPTKNLATGEGGAIVSNDEALLRRLRLFCSHNMQRSNFSQKQLAYDERGVQNPWFYEVQAPGLNLRMSEFHAALGLCQLDRLDASMVRRQELAKNYREALRNLDGLTLHPRGAEHVSALHLFPVELDLARLGRSKAAVFEFFEARGIRLQVHYTPLHWQPAFSSLPLVRGKTFPALERVSAGLVSLPMFYGLTDAEQLRVISAFQELLGAK